MFNCLIYKLPHRLEDRFKYKQTIFLLAYLLLWSDSFVWLIQYLAANEETTLFRVIINLAAPLSFGLSVGF